MNIKDIIKAKLTVVLILAMVVLGCAGLQTTAGKICNPTADEKATADTMLAAIDAAQIALGIFVPTADIIQASTVLKTIRAGGCFFLAELNEVFKVVDGLNTKKAMLIKRGTGPVVLPQYVELRKFIQ
jgi:hypothetical protein